MAQAAARDNISIVGSSTVYPFATVVAERFGRSTSFKTPKIESTGSGGGVIQDAASSASLCALLAARDRATNFATPAAAKIAGDHSQ